MSMSTSDAEELLEACAAGYVSMTHPDVLIARGVLGEKKARNILRADISRNDAMLRRVPGCAGMGCRR